MSNFLPLQSYKSKMNTIWVCASVILPLQIFAAIPSTEVATKATLEQAIELKIPDQNSEAEKDNNVIVDKNHGSIPTLKKVEPMTHAEIQQVFQNMQIQMNQRIETWGNGLKPDDFERSWAGRQLKKNKRQEVCGIYQKLINDIVGFAAKNQARLPPQDKQLLQDRSAFIQSLGYENNVVDTKMGFNCRLK